MTLVSRLTDLKQGQKAVVSKLYVFQDMRRRLQDMGLVEGTTVECVGKSPLGDPSAFLIRGAVIALRGEDAGRIEVAYEAPAILAGDMCKAGDARRANDPHRAKEAGKLKDACKAGGAHRSMDTHRAGQKGREACLWD